MTNKHLSHISPALLMTLSDRMHPQSDQLLTTGAIMIETTKRERNSTLMAYKTQNSPIMPLAMTPHIVRLKPKTFNLFHQNPIMSCSRNSVFLHFCCDTELMKGTPLRQQRWLWPVHVGETGLCPLEGRRAHEGY